MRALAPLRGRLIVRGTIATMLLLAVVGLFIYLGSVAWDAMHALPERKVVQQVAATASEELALTRIGSIGRERSVAPTGDENDVRYVDGDGIVAARVGGELVRLPAKLEYGPPPQPPRAPDGYKLPVVDSAGVIDVRSHKIHLDHIKPPSADLECTTASGVAWPCGRRARTAMRRLVRRRTIECLDEEIEQTDDGEVRIAVCTVGGLDMSRWLVEQGWAVPTDDAPDDYRTAHLTAQNLQRGLFNNNPR